MTSITPAILSTTNLNEVNAGIRVFTRLLGLEMDQMQAKYAAGEADAELALESVKQLMYETKRLIGKSKHVGKPFDFVEDVKLDMTELLLLSDDQVQTAIKRKRNLPLYHLVVSPVVELFRQFDHATAIQNVDVIIDHIIQTAFEDDSYGTYEDGLIAQAQVRRIIRVREEQSKVEAVTHRKLNRKVAKRLALEVAESLEHEPT